MTADSGSRPASQHQLQVCDSATLPGRGRHQGGRRGRRDRAEVEVDGAQRPAQLAGPSEEPEHEVKCERGRQRRGDHVDQVPADRARAVIAELREVPAREVDAEQQQGRGQGAARRAQRDQQDDRQLADTSDQRDPALGAHFAPRIQLTRRSAANRVPRAAAEVLNPFTTGGVQTHAHHPPGLRKIFHHAGTSRARTAGLIAAGRGGSRSWRALDRRCSWLLWLR